MYKQITGDQGRAHPTYDSPRLDLQHYPCSSAAELRLGRAVPYIRSSHYSVCQMRIVPSSDPVAYCFPLGA